ncbi:Sin3A associated protein 18, partial [Chelydra serpentina]
PALPLPLPGRTQAVSSRHSGGGARLGEPLSPDSYLARARASGLLCPYPGAAGALLSRESLTERAPETSGCLLAAPRCLARPAPGGKMAVESRVTQEEIKKEPEKPIDREKTCPLLLRVFTTNNGRHHRMDEFSRGNVPSSELQIYTWMDATLKELTSLVKEVYPEARKKGTHFNFAIVFTELKRPGYRVKEIGSTMSGRKGTDDSMTLQSQKFQIGDYLDIAITPPNRAPPPSGRMRPY